MNPVSYTHLALTSDQNVTQQMAVRFAENMVGLPRALGVSDARKAAPGDKVTVKGAVLGDEPVFSKNIASFTIAVSYTHLWKNGKVKLALGLGKGKTHRDQRYDLKARVEMREAQREVARINRR